MAADLIKYIPPILKEIREFKALINCENPEINQVNAALNEVRDNQHIRSLAPSGAQRWETALKITSRDTDVIEFRRFRLLARFNERLPYTFSTLIDKMDLLCGDGNYELQPTFDAFAMGVVTYLEQPGEADELARLLERFVPCNLVIEYSNEIHCTTYGNGVVAAGMASCEIVDLSDSYKAEFNITGNPTIAGGYAGRVEITISDNYMENITVNGNSIAGSGVTITSDVGII